MTQRGYASEALFFELALEDLGRAAEMFLPVHVATAGTDGWVSLEVSPLLAYETEETTAEAIRLSRRANRRNLFVKIPGRRGAAGDRGGDLQRRSGQRDAALLARSIRGGGGRLHERPGAPHGGRARARHTLGRLGLHQPLGPRGGGEGAEALANTLGVAVGTLAYKAYRDVLDSDRWQRLANRGAAAQRLLFASTSVKDPKAPDTLYVQALAAPNTVDTMPAGHTPAFADHGKLGAVLPRDGGDAASVLVRHRAAGIDVAALATRLQTEGAQAFVDSWKDLLKAIDTKSRALN